MSDNKNTLQNITISSDGISSARFTPQGMKKAMEQLIDEHQKFAEQARSGKEQLEVKESRIFELEGRLEAKERLLEEWGVDREKMVNKISELEMNIAGLKRDLDDWRGDAQEWQDLMVRVGGNDTWTAQDIESHYQMSPKGNQGQERVTLSGQGFTISRSTVPRVITAEELKPGQELVVQFEMADGSPGWRLHHVAVPADSKSMAGQWNQIVLLEDAPAEEPVTAEEIRASEPGSTFECFTGEVWEWDGEKLHIHTPSGDSMKVAMATPENLEVHMVTRSSAQARGDYSVKPVKVGDTISAWEELEGLPEGTILRGSAGDAFERGATRWWRTGSGGYYLSSDLGGHVTFTVLYLPEEDA